MGQVSFAKWVSFRLPSPLAVRPSSLESYGVLGDGDEDQGDAPKAEEECDDNL